MGVGWYKVVVAWGCCYEVLGRVRSMLLACTSPPCLTSFTPFDVSVRRVVLYLLRGQ